MTALDITSRVPTLEQVVGERALTLYAKGVWTAVHAQFLESEIAVAELSDANGLAIEINLSAVEKLDTFGAWLIERLRRHFVGAGTEPVVTGVSSTIAELLREMRNVEKVLKVEASPRSIIGLVEAVGRATAEFGDTLVSLANMIGATLAATFRVARHPSKFRLTSTVHHLEQACWRAVPIVVLITFLIGSIIAQQGIFHFRQFGADVFVVDMLGVLVLREIGVLLVAIMVAGRSGSAFTAELGSMKMREEIDALRTMGFDATEVLILPRVLALVIALPLLAFLGGIAALYGGGLVAWLYGGMQPDAFLARLRESISINHFLVGMIKAPFMAALIGIIACVEGMAVKGSAESLGQHTTASVVKAIFFVIVLDGAFAIFFAAIGI